MKKIIIFLIFLVVSFAQPVVNYSVSEINTAIGRSLDEFNKTIWFHSEGLSTNTGTNVNAPLENLTQAIAKANSLNPATNYRIAIVSVDVFIDASNYTIPNYVSVFVPFSTYSGTITLGTSSSFIDISDIGGAISINDVTNLSDSLLTKINFKDSTKYATPYDLTSGLALKVNKADSTGTGYATQYDISLKLNKADSTIYSTPYDLYTGLLPKLNIADSSSYATQYEIRYLDATSSVQTQINSKKNNFAVKDSAVTSVNKQGSSALKGNVELVGAGTVSLNQTGNTITITGLGGSGTGGEINVGANLGDGTDIYAGKVDTTLTFKSLKTSGYLANSFTDTTITFSTSTALQDSLNTRFRRSDTTSTLVTQYDNLSKLNKSDSTLYATQYDLTQVGGGGGFTFIYKTADESITNSTTLQNDDHLTFNYDASSKYVIELTVFYSGASNGITADYSASTSLTKTYASTFGADNLTNAMRVSAMTSAASVQVSSISANSIEAVRMFQMNIYLSTNTSGTFNFKFAQSANDSNTITVHEGSCLKYKKL